MKKNYKHEERNDERLAYEMLTRTGRNFYEITSAMQNSIRKGEYEIAAYCLWELLPQYLGYLRKRFLVISAEDCFGVLTKEILALSEKGDEEAITKALSLLCLAKKNRDADYFVCNLMYSDYPGDEDKKVLADRLFAAIRKKDVINAGKYSYELFKKNRKHLWQLLIEMSQIYYPHLEEEVRALAKANDTVTKPSEETIFAAKAIVLMWTCKEPKENILAYESMDFDELLKYEDIPIIKPPEECAKVNGLFPEWCYNWHTYHGKYKLGRDAIHAIENDQRILTPLEENLFDDCTWNRDINICLQKHNPKRHSIPYDDGKRRPSEKFAVKE